ncbi:MAG: nitrate- and nitrite sensing domain-containing protein, partial [Spirochaetota bacterium]|nr:nitrate- and nitrite sensing domain-containing protein [Spirochaetota bacterium]
MTYSESKKDKKKMTLKTKLILLLMLPAIPLGYLAADSMVTKIGVAKEMEAVQKLSRLNVRISSLVHETQKERGATGLFLGSGGKEFEQELKKQRIETDNRISKLDILLSNMKIKSYDSELEAFINGALGDLKRIKEVRNKVISLSIQTKDALAYYTGMNKKFLDTIAFSATVSSDTSIMRLTTCYVNFLKGKERAGIERAVLSSTFAGGKFGPGMFQYYVSLKAAQENYLDVFLSLAN